jgi:hypothetical protein
MRSGISALCAVFVFLLLAGNASAQTVRGIVVDDSTKQPLADVTIVLLTTRGENAGKPPVRTDSAGRFLLHAGVIGRYQVRATRIGYQPLTSQNLNLAFGGHIADVTLRMTVAASRLGAVVVNGTARYTNSDLMSHVGFDLRMSKGQGKFMTSDILASLKTQTAAWVLEDNKVLFGIEIVADGNGNDSLRMLRGSQFCVPEVWIDGWEANPTNAMARLMGLGADEIYGIESYSGLQLPPPSIGGEIGAPSIMGSGRGRSASNTMRQNQSCGAIAVWTKAFAREQEAKKKPPPSAP